MAIGKQFHSVALSNESFSSPMETHLSPRYKDTPEGVEANAILRACVHCGLCAATCPTYQLLGDERDGPRGRIYLIKQALEGQPVSRITQRHLDRCLICTACEVTCPAGVRYRHLLRIGRAIVDAQVPRPRLQRLQRLALGKVLPYPGRFSPVFRLGRMLRPGLTPGEAPFPPRGATGKAGPEPQPAPGRATLPALSRTGAASQGAASQGRVLMLAGCVQPVATPGTNAALARLLAGIGVGLVPEPGAGCCGAIGYHLGATDEGMARMRGNMDAWWPHVAAGVEGIVVSASGCAAMVRDYGYIFRHDPRYAEKAARVSALVKDPVELLGGEDLSGLGIAGHGRRIAFHAPCTLRRRPGLVEGVEALLRGVGFELTPVADAHLCCGSAGTYSLLQPALSRQLLANKLSCLTAGEPALIATANVGCQLHLAGRAGVPVVHWVAMLGALADSDTPSDAL